MSRRLVTGLVGALAALAGCGSDDQPAMPAISVAIRCPPAPVGARVMDEQAGRLGSLRLGLPRSRSLALTRGDRPQHLHDGKVTDLAGCGLHDLSTDLPSPVTYVRYRDKVLAFGGRPSRLVQLAVVGRGARTTKGLTIGDRLDDVKRVYAGNSVSCGHEIGDDGPLWPSCRVTGPSTRLFFGGDPVTLIEMQLASCSGAAKQCPAAR